MRNSFSLNQNKNTVDVLFSFNGRDQYARPILLTWNDEEYRLGGVQFWYAESRKAVRVHHYRVSDEHGEYTFELSLETENLTWSLDRATKTVSNGIGISKQFVRMAS
jgi:hypothetical protein